MVGNQSKNLMIVAEALADTIISEVVLLEEVERNTIVDFFLVKGHAGSGKTITLKRIAWDSAIEYNRIVLYWDLRIK
jgi:DNA helicase IV